MCPINGEPFRLRPKRTTRNVATNVIYQTGSAPPPPPPEPEEELLEEDELLLLELEDEELLDEELLELEEELAAKVVTLTGCDLAEKLLAAS